MLEPTSSTTNMFSPGDVSVHWLLDARLSPPMGSLHHMLMQVRRQPKTKLNVRFVVNFPPIIRCYLKKFSACCDVI